jgi:hypothetical protein
MNANTQTLSEIFISLDNDLHKLYDKKEFERIYTLIYNTDVKILKKSVFKVTKNNVDKGKLNLLELVKLFISDYYEDITKSDAFKRSELVRIGDLLETKYKRNKTVNGPTQSLRLTGGRSKKSRRLTRRLNNLRIQ